MRIRIVQQTGLETPSKALELIVDGAAIPPPSGVRVEAGCGGLMRVEANGTPRLWARQHRYLQGIWVVGGRSTESPSVLPPWRVSEARSLGSPEASENVVRWAKAIAERLATSKASPLSRGTFRLEAVARRERGALPVGDAPLDNILAWDAIWEHQSATWFRWEGTFGVVHALRRCPSDSDARVRTWRKAAREGLLPPVLLQWVSGLNGYVLLDGHARLRAAQLEKAVPQFVVLWRVAVRANDSPAWRTDALARYGVATRHFSDFQPRTALELNRELTEAFDPCWTYARSTALARRNLGATFPRDVLQQLGEGEST